VAFTTTFRLLSVSDSSFTQDRMYEFSTVGWNSSLFSVGATTSFVESLFSDFSLFSCGFSFTGVAGFLGGATGTASSPFRSARNSSL
jgi:hypothetical protein